MKQLKDETDENRNRRGKLVAVEVKENEHRFTRTPDLKGQHPLVFQKHKPDLLLIACILWKFSSSIRL